MTSGDETIRVLRDAVDAAPDNSALRRHLGETLLQYGRPEEAEREFHEALRRDPDDQPLKIGLARAFEQQGKNTHALVIVEDLIKLARPPAQVHLLYARLLLRAGEVERAVHHYRESVALDPSLTDPDLAEQLGIGADHEDAEVVDGRLRALADPGGGGPAMEIERPTIRFDDVGGMDRVKEEIRVKIIHPLTHPEIYEAYGKKVGGGILMYGPPGCGKTYLARATAGEVQAGFLAVGIEDVVEMWIGQSERNLHELFENARDHRPSVLFFDEVDALGAKRSDMRQSAGRQLINQFLAELDGIKSSNEGLLILAATNAPWHLDQAFRRPGRFDRVIFVPPPDEAARTTILRIHLRGKPVQDVDHERIAQKTRGFSGADLKAVVDLAVEKRLVEAVQSGVPAPLTTRELLAAVKQLKPTTKEWFATARNYALYSNKGGEYDDVLEYLDTL